MVNKKVKGLKKEEGKKRGKEIVTDDVFANLEELFCVSVHDVFVGRDTAFVVYRAEMTSVFIPL